MSANWAAILARWTLTSFPSAFLLSRLVVLLIMSRRLPHFFLFVGQTHVHHLNYGIECEYRDAEYWYEKKHEQNDANL